MARLLPSIGQIHACGRAFPLLCSPLVIYSGENNLEKEYTGNSPPLKCLWHALNLPFREFLTRPTRQCRHRGAYAARLANGVVNRHRSGKFP